MRNRVTAPRAGDRGDLPINNAASQHRKGVSRSQPSRIGYPELVKTALLFDQFQQGAAVLAVRRFRILRSFRRRVSRQHRITQRLQFRLRNSIKFHPEREDRHGQQLGGIPVGAGDESRPAPFQRCENRVQSFF